MESILIVFTCSQFAWVLVFVLMGLYIWIIRSCYALTPGGSPDVRRIDFLLQQHKAYVYFRLQGKMTPKLFPKLLYHHAVEPTLLPTVRQMGEIPYIKIFILLHNEVSPGTGNSLMMQRRKVASKPRPDSKKKESLNNALNPELTRLVAGRPLPQFPVRLSWWLLTMAAKLQQDDAPRAADCHDSTAKCC